MGEAEKAGPRRPFIYFTKRLVPLGVTEGESVIFQATIKANPPGFLSWFKESTALHEGDNVSLGYDAEKDLAQLVIAEAKMEDAGKYTVVAKNEAGQIFSSANLTVESSDHQ